MKKKLNNNNLNIWFNEDGMCSEAVILSFSEFGNISPELNAVLQAGFMGMFIGACYGGFVNSKVAYTDFMERNEATVFKSHFEAKVCSHRK
jgi:hypothetical protein